MAWWNKKRKEASDRHREFIYLDEVSVISLLAGLQGEIKESVTNTLARADETSVSASIAGPGNAASLGSKFGSTRTTTNEVVRRAVIQSTFRDLWQRDIGVLLHDTTGMKEKVRKPIADLADLERSMPRLKKSKLVVALNDIRRGDLVEMDLAIEADQFFKMVTVGSTFLDLMEGRESLFGVSANDLRQVAPMIEVLKELSVGLVPVRGLSTSHCVIDLGGESLVIAKVLLTPGLLAESRPLELVGFAESGSFWRDLRRTLFSGATYTAYARVERAVLETPWTPIKIADLLESVSPGLRDEVAAPFEKLSAGLRSADEDSDADELARFQLEGFADELRSALDIQVDGTVLESVIVASGRDVAEAATLVDQRRAFESVAVAIGGADIDRDTLLTVRSNWMTRTPDEVESMTGERPDTVLSNSPVQVEVGFVALYW